MCTLQGGQGPGEIAVSMAVQIQMQVHTSGASDPACQLPPRPRNQKGGVSPACEPARHVPDLDEKPHSPCSGHILHRSVGSSRSNSEAQFDVSRGMPSEQIGTRGVGQIPMSY